MTIRPDYWDDAPSTTSLAEEAVIPRAWVEMRHLAKRITYSANTISTINQAPTDIPLKLTVFNNRTTRESNE